MSTLIIAEAGVNHNGDLSLACELIDAAAEAGADLVKFQTFKAEHLVTPCAAKAEYQCRGVEKNESQYEMLKHLELTREMHEVLIDRCKKMQIGFFSTGFDIDSINLLVDLGQAHFKIPSGEITNLPYLRHIARFTKPIILSTGMATLGEIETALDVLEQFGTPLNLITVLHCNTEYPTPVDDVNLRAMVSIREAFGVKVGYSDHTLGIEVAIAAVALGASVIEKHLTLDCDLPGPDHRASLEPRIFKEMVIAIRNVEKALGVGRKRPSQSEIKNKTIARKSLVAYTLIFKGDKFTVDNITVKRPGTGVSPMYWDMILGKIASRDYKPDELIDL